MCPCLCSQRLMMSCGVGCYVRRWEYSNFQSGDWNFDTDERGNFSFGYDGGYVRFF